MTGTAGPPEALLARTIAFVAILFFVDLLLAMLLAHGYDPRAALVAATGSAALAAETAHRLLKA